MLPRDLASNASICLTASTSGDFETTRSLLSDDVTFDGPLGHSEGADAYVTVAARLTENVRTVDLKKLVVDGDDVCIMYDLVSEAAGVVPTVSWYHFTDDKIDAVRAYFDPRPLASKGQASESKKGFDMPLFAAALQLCPQD
jgi:hypothetical protein